MNTRKITMVLGVAACVTLVGCKETDGNVHKVSAQPTSTEVYQEPAENAAPEAETVEPAPEVEPMPAPEVEPTPAPMVQPMPAPEVKPQPAPEVKPQPAPEPETTKYVIRRGDTLSGICHKYHVKQAEVLKLNPKLNPNKILLGTSIKLPGKIDVPPAPAAAPAAASAKAAPAKQAYAPYVGETKEYTVVAGDTIGKIAYGNGINIRQFKELNGLKSDVIRVGQKVKIPAKKVEKPVAAASAPVKAAPAKPEAAASAKPEAAASEAKTAVEVKPATGDASEAAPVDQKIESAVDSLATAVGTVAADTASAAESAQPVVARPGEKLYQIKANDDIYSIAVKWNVTVGEIMELNGMTSESLTPGQTIRIPVGGEQ